MAIPLAMTEMKLEDNPGSPCYCGDLIKQDWRVSPLASSEENKLPHD